jgi:acyl-CoA synthetase (AMP-forming)/AMP-acid ligase II
MDYLTQNNIQLLLPSPRNSLEGQLSLFKATSCKAILSPKGYGLQEGLIHGSALPLFQAPEIPELLAEGEVRQYKFTKTWDEAKDDPVMVLHTSGSTGLPKPIVLGHSWIAALDSISSLEPFDGHAPRSAALAANRIFCCLRPFHVCNTLHPLWSLMRESLYIRRALV